MKPSRAVMTRVEARWGKTWSPTLAMNIVEQYEGQTWGVGVAGECLATAFCILDRWWYCNQGSNLYMSRNNYPAYHTSKLQFRHPKTKLSFTLTIHFTMDQICLILRCSLDQVVTSLSVLIGKALFLGCESITIALHFRLLSHVLGSQFASFSRADC